MSETQIIAAEHIFDGQRLLAGMAMVVENGRVTALEKAGGRKPLAGVITPGYLDLQVNGGGSVLVNNSPTAQAMRQIAAAHRRFGTVGILPTVITDAPEVLAAAVNAALEARGEPGILGLHVEGPHISLARRGTHRAGFIRPLDEATINLMARLRAAGVAVMITLAPEAVAPGQVARLVLMGCVVSIGHSDADAAAVQALLDEGASCFTHLFNAMSPMQARAPGMTGAAINSRADLGFICDGIHVADEMLGLAIRARPEADQMFLVSDAMATVGGADHFALYGQEIRLKDGRLVNSEGALAGAHVTMAEGLARLIRVLKIGPEAALRMAVTTPARVIGADAGLVGRDLADVLLLGPDWMPVAATETGWGPVA